MTADLSRWLWTAFAVALWLAKPLGYLPARLRTSAAQGDSTDHRLQKLPPPR